MDIASLICTQPTAPQVDERTRVLLLRQREALLMELRVIEDYLGLDHARPTKREKEPSAGTARQG